MNSKRRITISTEGWYYLFLSVLIAIGAVLRQVNLLVVISGLLVGLFVFNWRLVMSTLLQLGLKRRLPKQIFAGEQFFVHLAVSNWRRRLDGWALHLIDTIRLQGPRGTDQQFNAEVLVPHIKAGERKQVSYRCCLVNRGRYQYGPVNVVSRFPFGLIQAEMTIALPDSLIVYPQLGHFSSQWAKLLETHQTEKHSGRKQLTLGDGVFFGIREWRTGDSQRWIHWRSSARLNKLAVRQFEQVRQTSVALILDLWQSNESTTQERENVEIVLSIASSAVVDICRRDDTKLLVACVGNRVDKSLSSATPSFMHHVLEKLALVEAGTGENIFELLNGIHRAIINDATVVIISTRSCEAAKNAIPKSNNQGPFPGRLIDKSEWIDVSDSKWKSFFQLSSNGDSIQATSSSLPSKERQEEGVSA